jgi:hypothetical protein
MPSHNPSMTSESSENSDAPGGAPNIVRFPAAQKSAGQRPAPGTDRPEPQRAGDEEPLSTRALIGLGIFLVVLVLSGVWLMNTLRDMGQMQDCAMQGRRNCAPIDPPRDR